MLRRRIIVGILSLASAVLFATIVFDGARLVGRAFPGFMIWDNGMLLAFHDSGWTGVAAGLPSYGRLLAVDGEPFHDRAALLERIRARPVGSVFEYTILVHGSQRSVAVPSMRLRLDGYLGTFGIYLFGGAVCWLTAFGLLYLRGEEVAARGVAVMLFLVGLTLVLAVDLIGTSRFGRSLALVEAATPISILHFASVFPRPRLAQRLRRSALAVGYAGALAFGAFGASHFYDAPEFSRRFNDFAYLGVAAALLVALVSLGRAVVRETSSVYRVRAAIVFAGAVAACTVPAVALPAFFALGWSISWSLVFAPVFFFPVAIVYAVVRHDLFEAERFIRLSLGYAVASIGATTLYAFVLWLLDLTILPDVGRSPAAALIFIFVLALSINPFLVRTQRAIDRYFYRSPLDPGKVLETLGQDLTECATADSIRARVEQSLGEALALESVHFAAESPHARPAGDSFAVPVVFRSEPMGVIVCGPKKSGAPFSRADRDLVTGASAQAGIALRNARSMADLQLAQEELVRKERLATMGELAGSVAHGVRNPLAGIRATAQIARQHTDDADLRESLTGIIDESDRLENRVRALLDFSRPFKPNLGRVDPREVVEAVRRAVASRASRTGIGLEVDVACETALEASDANFLEEALLELVGNAMRVLEPSGRGRIRLGLRSEQGDVIFSVEDTGPGIPVEVQSRIFDIFFTTRAEGTGMGLATVKRIAEALGGGVSVRSQPGEGTTLSLRIPVEGPVRARIRGRE